MSVTCRFQSVDVSVILSVGEFVCLSANCPLEVVYR